MYAVVGCGECEALWVVESSPETTECPRCGHRREHALRTKFYTSGDADAAREARSRLLAERQGEADAFAEVDAFADLEGVVAESGVDDETYLAGSGLDPDAVAAAGERAEHSSGEGSESRQEVVRRALSELDRPTAAAVREYGERHGIEADAVDRTLEKLLQAGDVTERDGTYRLL